MKRILFILLATLSTAVCSAGTDAMSNSKVRKETRFLTDKMAYELNLNTEQYNDVYEINYDFISGIRYLMDDVLVVALLFVLSRRVVPVVVERLLLELLRRVVYTSSLAGARLEPGRTVTEPKSERRCVV